MQARLRLRILLNAAAVALGVAAVSPAVAADEPPCTRAQAAEADKWLSLSRRHRAESLQQNLPWGAPQPIGPVRNERTLIHWDFVVRHDNDLRVPLWTAERVIGANLGKAKRSDCFRADPRLSAANAATPNDYVERIFDQGHMTPSANVTTSKVSVWNSFVMSNMTPQFCQFNRGIWQILEELVRRWSVQHGTIHVISGSLFDRDGDGARDPDIRALMMKPTEGERRVAIPSAFYKVVAVELPDGSVQSLAFLLPHDQADLDGAGAITYLRSRVVGLATIEQLAAVKLLPTAPRIVQSTNLWPFKGQPPRTLARLGTQCRGTAGAVIP